MREILVEDMLMLMLLMLLLHKDELEDACICILLNNTIFNDYLYLNSWFLDNKIIE